MPPQQTLDRHPVPRFEDDEYLFRRYISSHFHEGELDPSAIRFDEPPSFLRSGFSTPADALHVDCAEGQVVTAFGVLAMQANAASGQESTEDGNTFTFLPSHQPLPSCYAHSEIHCLRAGDPNYQHTEPPKRIRKAFRLRIARALSVAIPAP